LDGRCLCKHRHERRRGHPQSEGCGQHDDPDDDHGGARAGPRSDGERDREPEHAGRRNRPRRLERHHQQQGARQLRDRQAKVRVRAVGILAVQQPVGANSGGVVAIRAGTGRLDVRMRVHDGDGHGDDRNRDADLSASTEPGVPRQEARHRGRGNREHDRVRDDARDPRVLVDGSRRGEPRRQQQATTGTARRLRGQSAGHGFRIDDVS